MNTRLIHIKRIIRRGISRGKDVKHIFSFVARQKDIAPFDRANLLRYAIKFYDRKLLHSPRWN